MLDLMIREIYQATWRCGSRGRRSWGGQLTSRKYELWHLGIACGVIYGFRFMNNLTQVNMWEAKMRREAESSLNDQ